MFKIGRQQTAKYIAWGLPPRYPGHDNRTKTDNDARNSCTYCVGSRRRRFQRVCFFSRDFPILFDRARVVETATKNPSTQPLDTRFALPATRWKSVQTD